MALLAIGSAREEPMGIKRASLWRVLILVKGEAFKEPEQHWAQ
jgi:hypothetical protein